MALPLRIFYLSLSRLHKYTKNSLLNCSKKKGYCGKKFLGNSVSHQSLQQPLVEGHSTPSASKSVHFKVGDRLNGFVVNEVESVPEFQLVAVKLNHEATGSEYLHIEKNDSNNVFSVIFRTTPMDSTGLPHILEHTTLCGSEKFPCRDPFFKMLNRSLATFMNAMTAPDYTMYPFSTQNPTDFKNLLSVYLDAVFRPNLREMDFHQEGWRLEHTNPTDPSTPIIIKGVVYNEMKGVFADNQNLFEYALLSGILPSHTYSVCSGGDPLIIPSLLYQDLKNFHFNYYSPLNAKYYSYGNFPLTNHLKILNDEYLQQTQLKGKTKIDTVVPSEKRWNKPIRKHIKCRVDPMAANKDKQSSIAISVLCCSVLEVEECLLLKVLSELLVNGPNSSFYKPLIEPNIGAGFSPVTGYESQTRDTFFTVGLQDVSEKDFQKIIQIYEDTIDEVIKTGFDQKNLEAILHSIELNLKHQTSNFGLELLFSIVPTLNHDGNVIKYLKIESRIEKLKQKILEDPQYLQKAVAKYFKNNEHKLILTMSPDPNYESEEKKKEEELINEKIKNLNEEEKRKIFEDGLKLLELQKHDDKSCLPSLKISDLRKDTEKIHMTEKNVDGISVYLIPQPTNGITYFRGLVTLGNFEEKMRSYLSLYSVICTKMGTKKRDYKEFEQLSSLTTGGLSISTHFKPDIDLMDHLEESLIISSYCLNRNIKPMFNLWLEIFQEMELTDVRRFAVLVNSQAASLVNGITISGHHYAMLSSSSLVSGSSLIKEQNSGLTFVKFMKNIVQSDLNEVLNKMIEIRDKVMTRSRMRCAINIMDKTQDQVLEEASKFLKNTRGNVEESNQMQDKSLAQSTTRGLFYVLPIPVSYTGKTIVTVPYTHKDCSVLEVLARLMTMKYLHPEIREKGGAYGGGVVLSASGLLNFYSYRDPNPLNSHAVYDNAISWLRQGNFTQEDVNEAKLGLFQSIDTPIPPGDKGMRWFLYGITDDSFQKRRLRIIDVTKDKIIEVGEKYLGENNTNPVGRAVIGPINKDLLENKQHNWKTIEV